MSRQLIAEYGLALNIFRNGSLAPSCVSLIPFGFNTTVLLSNTVESTLFLCVATPHQTACMGIGHWTT